MSNARRTGIADDYRRGYLRSPAWFARRDHWFRDEAASTGSLSCAACQRHEASKHLELHHLDYTGVTRDARGWHAREHHDDLVALHPYCHEQLHRLIDRDPVLARLRGRRTASCLALGKLRDAFRTLETAT